METEIEKIKMEFVGLDDWSRPVFKVPSTSMHFGSTEKLFNWSEVEGGKIYDKIELTDLCYFGSSFNCEPLGGTYLTEGKIMNLLNGRKIEPILERPKNEIN